MPFMHTKHSRLKSLIQDQMKSLQVALRNFVNSSVQVYALDGDTSSKERLLIREQARIILTNVDILHYSLLPFHHKWKRFLSNLKLIVIDGKFSLCGILKKKKVTIPLKLKTELHYYSGEFGLNTAVIFRRLRRVCKHYENENIKFIGCSATAPNPAEVLCSFHRLMLLYVVPINFKKKKDVLFTNRIERRIGSRCGKRYLSLWKTHLCYFRI